MPTPTFDEVWANVHGIHGRFKAKCGRKLYYYAMHCKPKSQFVEIGSFCGRSASILLQVAKAHRCNLTLVDNFAYGRGAKELTNNLAAARFGHYPYTLMVMSSKQAAERFRGGIQLLHIDGNHSRAAEDAELWLPKVKTGGWVFFHDWCQGAPNVMEAVAALGKDYQDFGIFASLAIRRKLR